MAIATLLARGLFKELERLADDVLHEFAKKYLIGLFSNQIII